MIIKTRDFDEIEIDENDSIFFEMPVIGFEDSTEYVFLFNDSFGTDIAWLQSVKEPELCFILASAALAKWDYSGKAPKDVRAKLGDGEYDAWLVMVVGETAEQSTVNLRSPIFVNAAQRKAAQAVLEEDLSVRYALFTCERED